MTAYEDFVTERVHAGSGIFGLYPATDPKSLETSRSGGRRTTDRERQRPMFNVDQFIADLRATLGERSRKAMKEVVAARVSDPSAVVRTPWASPRRQASRCCTASPDLTVLTLAWAPMQVTLPHDHRMSAVIGMYGGREDNTFWRRTRNGSRFAIEPAAARRWAPAMSTLLGPDIVHSVVNPLGKISAAIHVYDGTVPHDRAQHVGRRDAAGSSRTTSMRSPRAWRRRRARLSVRRAPAGRQRAGELRRRDR